MRDALIIFFSIIAAMAVGGYLYLNGTPSTMAPTPDAEPQAILDANTESFTVLIQGIDSGSVTRRTNYRITDDVQLTELWKMIYGDGGPSIPLVDFTRYEIIGVFNGSHSTGGHSVTVTGIIDRDGTRVVRIRREAPGDTCVVTQGFTSPFQLVRVEKTNLPIIREEETVTTVCP